LPEKDVAKSDPMLELFGMEEVLSLFDRLLLWPKQYAVVYKEFGLQGSALPAIMLCGPSGRHPILIINA
jgi:hypothetical protein